MMNRILPGLMLTMCAFLLLSESAFAGYMRCGSHLIVDGGRNGPGKYEVLKKCGNPTERHGNTWIYAKPGKPKRVLHFNPNGLLTSIN